MPAVVSDLADGEPHQSTLAISVWFEPGHSEPFRARLTSNSGAAAGTVASYAGSREAVLAGVSEWLHSLHP